MTAILYSATLALALAFARVLAREGDREEAGYLTVLAAVIAAMPLFAA